MKRLTRRQFIGSTICLLLIVCAGSAWWVLWKYRADWQTQIQDLKAQKLPVCWADVDAYYTVPPGQSDLTAQWLPAIDSLSQKLARIPEASKLLSENNVVRNRVPGEPWSELDNCRQLIDSIEGDLQPLRDLSKQSGGVRFPVRYANGPVARIHQHKQYHQISQALALSSHVHAAQGQYHNILNSILAGFRLSQIIRREPTLLSFSMGNSAYLLAFHELKFWLPRCSWTDHELEQLQRELLSSDFPEEMRYALIGERGLGLQTIQTSFSGPIQDIVMAEYLRIMRELIASYEEPQGNYLTAQQATYTRLQSLSRRKLSPLKYTFVPNLAVLVRTSGSQVADFQTYQRGALLLIAAQRYRLRHGRYPLSITQLQATELWPIPWNDLWLQNPVTREPMKFQFSDSSFTIECIRRSADSGSQANSTMVTLPDSTFRISGEENPGM